MLASSNPRQLALQVLLQVQAGAYADVALHRQLLQASLSGLDRALVTELVYGIVRRQRTLDELISQLGRRPAAEQPPLLRLILRLGLYQLRYLTTIPVAAAVHSTVELAKMGGLGGLAGVVNAILRHYYRLSQQGDPLRLPDSPGRALAIGYSYPDWIGDLWIDQLGHHQAEALAAWFNQPPTLDLRINRQRTTLEQVQDAFSQAALTSETLADLPWALRLLNSSGAITDLPGYQAGWWSVQDASAQMVSEFLAPQPGETVLDVCAAPGGKATHLAELMADQGQVWACDRTPSRLSKIKLNCDRLGLTSVYPQVADSTDLPQFHQRADRVLVDVPCSGLGTLHRHADARWRQQPEGLTKLIPLQLALLTEAARCVKPGGLLVYSTCTLQPAENQGIVQTFLAQHPNWQIQPPSPPLLGTEPEGWV
ncbi:MAG: 16S rRNA (cytosine(967)-C(5))-methyltransferase, partial [Nodosilinea sp.]